MLEANTVNLKIEIDRLNTLIEEYEVIQLNLFNELKDSCINWQDGNTITFEEKIYLEKKESALILQTLIDKKEVLTFIYNKYSDLGKKISCDLNKRDTLLYDIKNCENQVNNIINEFYKIDNTFYYKEYQSITYQRSKIFNVRNELTEFKNSIIKTYNKIEQIEREIKEKIEKLEILKINNFDFNLG